ncbi:ANTAR domain-containing protein [Streptomyces sp. NPDC046727]|uniref:ANTAR domain-containing protein n=1 Tax=Streptomyces sp. NPDC046727 TaxID=3155373 RepID=UPI0033E4DD96
MQERSDLDRENRDLRKQIEQLTQAIDSHAVIDQAIGVVIAYSGVQPPQGWTVLKEVSQHTNVKLREVAAHVVQWPQCKRLPPEIRRALDASLERQRLSRLPSPHPPDDDS